MTIPLPQHIVAGDYVALRVDLDTPDVVGSSAHYAIKAREVTPRYIALADSHVEKAWRDAVVRVERNADDDGWIVAPPRPQPAQDDWDTADWMRRR